MHPVLRHAITFVFLSIAMQWIANSLNRTGPIYYIETKIFPHIVRVLGGTYKYDKDDDKNDNDYTITCPPDEWIDSAFAVREKHSKKDDDINGGDFLYSEKFDPRNKVVMQSLFPHCALQRWVKLGDGGSNLCRDGEEFVTIIRPTTLQNNRHFDTAELVNNGGSSGGGGGGGGDNSTDQQHTEKEQKNRIPTILHIASPTNCLPISTIQTLSRMVESASAQRTQSQNQPPIPHQHHHTIESQQLVIYIHSHQAMQHYLFMKEFPIFPEVKEGILCGMGKLKAVSRKAVLELFDKEEAVEEEAHRRWMQRIVDEIAFGVQRDIWRYLILWEYGGITMDISTLHAILLEGDSNFSNSENNTKNTVNATTAPESGDARLQKLMTQWWNINETSSDALIYFISNYFDNGESTPRERIPLTSILGAAPRHPFIYFSAKSALRYAIWDDEKSITSTGRSTQIPPINDGLMYINSEWEKISIGQIVNVLGYDMTRQNSIHLLNGNDALPTSLTSPSRTPWRSIFAAFSSSVTVEDGGRNSNTSNLERNNTISMPSEAKIMEVMQRIASDQTYLTTKSKGLFSCMEYRLDMYMPKRDQF